MSDGMSPSLSGAPEEAKKTSVLKIFFYSLLFISLVAFLSALKLPESRVTGLLLSQVQTRLDPYGIYISERGRTLSLFQGLKFTLDHPTIELPDLTRIELDDLSVRPNLAAFLFQNGMGGSASLHQGKSELSLNGSQKNDKIMLEAKLTEIDIGKMGILSFVGIKGGGTISGHQQLEGSLATLTSLSGEIDLKLKNIRVDEQKAYIFNLPLVQIAEGTILGEVKSGKLILKTVQIGKATDDLFGTVTGDITLNQNLNSSLLNLRLVFGTSQKIKNAIPILDSVLGSAKLSDGKYAYKLTGSFASPMFLPDLQK